MLYYFRDRIIKDSREANRLLWANCGEGDDFIEVMGGIGEVLNIEKVNGEYFFDFDMVSVSSPAPFSRRARMGGMGMSFRCSEEILRKLMDDMGIACLEDLIGTTHIVQSGAGANAICPYEFDEEELVEDYED